MLARLVITSFLAVTTTTTAYKFGALAAGEEVDLVSAGIAPDQCEETRKSRFACRSFLSHFRDVPVRASRIIILNGQLQEFYFSGKKSNYQKARRHVIAKYGQPDHDSIGAKSKTSQSRTEIWRFASGDLRLAQRYYLSDQFAFEYVARTPSKVKDYWFKVE